MAAAPPPPPVAPAPSPAPRTATQPVSAASIWQEKINGLFGRKSSERKGGASLAVASASKEPLDVQSHTGSVGGAISVSLPQKVDGDIMKDDHGDDVEESAAARGIATSQQVEEEEDLFEDREAGSLPVVRVPDMAPPAAWVAARPLPESHRVRSKNSKAMHVQSVDTYFISPDKDQAGNVLMFIRLPGASDAKSVILQHRKGGGGRRRSSHFKPRNNPKHAKSREGGVKKSSSSTWQTNGDGWQVNGDGSW